MFLSNCIAKAQQQSVEFIMFNNNVFNIFVVPKKMIGVYIKVFIEHRGKNNWKTQIQSNKLKH